MHGLVVPTRGDHEGQLDQIIRSAALPPHRTVIVTNSRKYRRPGVTLVYDLGGINIHRWWNLGLDVLQRLGCRYATVLNDDTVLPPGALRDMREALRRDGTTLAHPGTPGEQPGHAWTIDLRHGVRPDERYRWWYGDDQLYEDAHRKGRGVTALPDLHIAHTHHAHSTAHDERLQRLAEQDRLTWQRRSRA